MGAGALGGYFGGRLLEAGRDVTFLVRPRRAVELQRTGLVITSQYGDVRLVQPPHVVAGAIAGPFDVIVVACKAYDLPATMESLAPAVGPDTAILPLLNGMRHLDMLAERFGPSHVLGGACMISAVLGPDGEVLHLNDIHRLVVGEQNRSRSERVAAIAAAFSGAKAELVVSDYILHAMWEKWAFISSLAGITSLMRASVGDIVSAGGAGTALALLAECTDIVAAHGFVLRDESLEQGRSVVSAQGSALKASMLRDIERGAPTEADHILGDLLDRGAAHGRSAPLLRAAYTHVKAYELGRARNAANA